MVGAIPTHPRRPGRRLAPRAASHRDARDSRAATVSEQLRHSILGCNGPDVCSRKAREGWRRAFANPIIASSTSSSAEHNRGEVARGEQRNSSPSLLSSRANLRPCAAASLCIPCGDSDRDIAHQPLFDSVESQAVCEVSGSFGTTERVGSTTDLNARIHATLYFTRTARRIWPNSYRDGFDVESGTQSYSGRFALAQRLARGFRDCPEHAR